MQNAARQLTQLLRRVRRCALSTVDCRLSTVDCRLSTVSRWTRTNFGRTDERTVDGLWTDGRTVDGRTVDCGLWTSSFFVRRLSVCRRKKDVGCAAVGAELWTEGGRTDCEPFGLAWLSWCLSWLVCVGLLKLKSWDEREHQSSGILRCAAAAWRSINSGTVCLCMSISR